MAIVRWDPWRELAGIERQFDEMFGRGRAGSRGQGTGTWVPALDVHQDGDTMVINAEIAGVDPNNVEITIDDDVLTVSGRRDEDRKVEDGQWIRRERVTGQFRRSISLPPGVDPSKVKANATNGVIEIRVPRPTKSEPHRVELGGSGRERTEIGVESQQTTGDQAATEAGSNDASSETSNKAAGRGGSSADRSQGKSSATDSSSGKSSTAKSSTAKKASKSSRAR